MELTLWLVLQSISSPGSGIWSDGKDKNDVSQPHTWNVEVFIDIVKEVVRGRASRRPGWEPRLMVLPAWIL